MTDIDKERKPWEDSPTGPAPKDHPVIFSFDVGKIVESFTKEDERKISPVRCKKVRCKFNDYANDPVLGVCTIQPIIDHEGKCESSE